MKTIAYFSARAWHETSSQLRAAIGASSLFMAVLAFTCLQNGCATMSAGLAPEQRIYQVATNAVASAQQVVPCLPPPASSAAELALAIVSGALAAWNVHRK